MINVNKIFLGLTPKPFRLYLLNAFRKLQDQYPHLIVPCVGNFTIPSVAVKAGYKPKNIIASDISLFSSVLGVTAMKTSPMQALGVKFLDPRIQELTKYQNTPLEPAAIIFAIKYAQLAKKQSYYNLSIIEEILLNEEKYIQKMQENIDNIISPLTHINYRMKDIIEEFEENCNKENTIIFANPPAYKGGYTRMFYLGDVLSWDSPEIKEFDQETGYNKIYEILKRASALVIFFQYGNYPKELEDWVIFGAEKNKDVVEYLISNKPEIFKENKWLAQKRKTYEIKPGNYPLLFENHIITRNSKITFIPAKNKIALYYRDLFAHKLGVVKSHIYYLILIDGYLFATLGFDPAINRTGYRTYINEVFGFCVPNSRYPRLNKLMMMLILSEEFKNQMVRDFPNLMLFKPFDELHTTCITKYCELKINRGILKLVKRDKLPDGRYKLYYVSKFKRMSYQDCLINWLEKEKYG